MTHSPLFNALRAAVLSTWHIATPTAEQGAVADAIANAVEDDGDQAPLTGSHAQDAVLMAIYVWNESRVSTHPKGQSWDSLAGVSCGILQMPCHFVMHSALVDQASTWLRWAHEGGLAALDSSPSRAAKREAKSREILSSMLAEQVTSVAEMQAQ
jgi:hypothetical protein